MKPKQQGRGQMSEAFITTVFLTMSGGFQDAYTYLVRDQVFANAQTGNIVLMAANAMDGNQTQALHYLAPLFAFAAGVYVSEQVRRQYKNHRRFHWRQLVLVIEMALLLAVGFLPLHLNVLANSLVSFVCAMQVQAFRKVNGNAYASTMCIGNLRSGTEHLFTYLHGKNPVFLRKAANYYGIILLFAVGAAAGCLLCRVLGTRAIWCCCGLLFVSLCLMLAEEKSTPPAD